MTKILLEMLSVLASGWLLAISFSLYAQADDTFGTGMLLADAILTLFPIGYLFLRWLPSMKKNRAEGFWGVIKSGLLGGVLSVFVAIPLSFVSFFIFAFLAPLVSWQYHAPNNLCPAEEEQLVLKDGRYYFIGWEDADYSSMTSPFDQCADYLNRPFTGYSEHRYGQVLDGITTEVSYNYILEHRLFYEAGKVVRTEARDTCGELVPADGYYEFSCTTFGVTDHALKKGHIKDSKPDGVWESYQPVYEKPGFLATMFPILKYFPPTPNSVLEYKVLFIEGEPEGPFEAYSVWGDTVLKGTYVNGKRDALWEEILVHHPDYGDARGPVLWNKALYANGQIVFHEKYNYELFKEEDLKDEDLFGANPNKFTGSQKIYYGQNGEFCKELTYDKNGSLSNEIFSSKCNSDFN